MSIHPTAIVSPTAEIGEHVSVGPFCLIEDDVCIGNGTQLASHVVIKSGTRLGTDNLIETGAVLGGRPQHLAAGADVGDTVIGNSNQIREYVSIHRGFKPQETTRIGDHNLLMVSSHVGHDCHLGDHNILANGVMLGGHVGVQDRVYFGGGTAVHQFCRVGSYAMIGGMTRVIRDVPPYVLVDGDTACMVGLNSVGLRRAGFTGEDLRLLKAAYRMAFRSDERFEERVRRLQTAYPTGVAQLFWEFLSAGERGFLQDRRGAAKRKRSPVEGSATQSPPAEKERDLGVVSYPDRAA